MQSAHPLVVEDHQYLSLGSMTGNQSPVKIVGGAHKKSDCHQNSMKSTTDPTTGSPNAKESTIPISPGLIVFEPEEVESEAFFMSKSMENSRDWFVWVLGEKNLFSQFLSYLKVRFSLIIPRKMIHRLKL